MSEHIDEAQRSRINDLARQSRVFVNGKPKKPSYKIKAGDAVNGALPPHDPLTFTPEKIELDILFEDDYIIVINKQPGLVVHPAPGHWSGTLVNGLMYHCPDLPGDDDEIRPGIVHRLDRDTSGAMVVAKTREALLGLSESFHKRDVQKIYMAIVHGTVKNNQGKIELPIGRHPVHRKMMSTQSSRGKHAETHFIVKKRFSHATCLMCDIKTGRTHQIRVHCQAMGHPIVGDPVYTSRLYSKPRNYNNPLQQELSFVKRQMLHSYKLKIPHPVTKRKIEFHAPLPKDMEMLLSRLNAYNYSEI